jgi:hypothetical protein
MINWKNVAVRTKSGADPHIWRAEIGWLRITITDSHMDYRGGWVAVISQFRRDPIPLGAKSLEEAKAAALEIARETLRKTLAKLEGAEAAF